MGGQHGIGGTYREPIPQKVVGGIIIAFDPENPPVPDCTGNYEQIENYNGLPCFRSFDGVFYAWSIDEGQVVISTTLGSMLPGCWYTEDSPWWGEYHLFSQGTYLGQIQGVNV